MGDKRPKRRAQPEPRKHPRRTARPESAGEEQVCWRFSLADHDGQWAWINLSQTHHRDLAEKMRSWEGMTINSLCQHRAGNRGNHGTKFIPKKNMCADAQRRIDEHLGEDTDGLWELALDNKRRLWVQREANILSVIWWDPEHRVCPSQR